MTENDYRKLVQEEAALLMNNLRGFESLEGDRRLNEINVAMAGSRWRTDPGNAEMALKDSHKVKNHRLL